MPSAKFTLPVEAPRAATPSQAATLGQIEEVVTELTEPPVDLLLVLENALT